MRAKIVDIGLGDAFYDKKGRFMGQVGNFISDGKNSGEFNFDNPELGGIYYFADVKVEPLPDEPIKTEPAPAIERHGHPNFYKLCNAEMELHSIKNHDYAHGGDPLGNFNRVSAIKGLYPKLNWSSPVGVAIGYLLKQFDAALWMQSEGHTAKVEGPIGRWQDVSIYSKIIEILIMEEKPDKCC